MGRREAVGIAGATWRWTTVADRVDRGGCSRSRITRPRTSASSTDDPTKALTLTAAMVTRRVSSGLASAAGGHAVTTCAGGRPRL